MIRKLGVFLLGIIPPLMFAYFCFYHTQNLVIFDDYTMVAGAFLGELKASTISEKLTALFAQHNEYRFPILTLMSMFQYKVFGQIHFNYYPYIGDFSLLGLYLVVYSTFRRVQSSSKLLPMVYLMFPLHIYIIITWANSSCQYLWALFYSIWTVYLLLQKNSKWNYLAFGTVLMGIFSFGSGIFALPLGAVILLVERKYKLLFAWLTYAAIIVGFYFHGYQKQPFIELGLKTFQEHPTYIPLGFLYIWGGWADLSLSALSFWKATIPGIAGFLTLLLVFYVLWKSFLNMRLKDQTTHFVASFTFYTLGYLLFTTSVIAFGRTGSDPEFTMLVSNHRYYAFMALALVYGYFVMNVRFAHFAKIALGFSMAIFFLGYAKFWGLMSSRAKLLAAVTFNHYYDGVPPTHPHYNPFYFIKKTNDSLMNHYNAYVFPATPLHKEWKAFAEKPTFEKDTLTLQSIVTDSTLTLNGNNLEQSGLHGTYYLLKSKEHLFVYNPSRVQLASRKPYLQSSEYNTIIPKDELYKGSYDLILCNYQNSEAKYYKTNLKWNIL